MALVQTYSWDEIRNALFTAGGHCLASDITEYTIAGVNTSLVGEEIWILPAGLFSLRPVKGGAILAVMNQARIAITGGE